jgi:two-component system CheB/CheR fusion protein
MATARWGSSGSRNAVGLTVAQDPEEAEHPSMPRSAIDTGMVDWVLPVEQMPERLLQYRRKWQSGSSFLRRKGRSQRETARRAGCRRGCAARSAHPSPLPHGRDFSYYKRATVVRRLARRMQVNSVATMQEYLLFVRTHPGEVGALQEDLLISVTNFFRDRACFAAWNRTSRCSFTERSRRTCIASGPLGAPRGEAYSIAMLLLEERAAGRTAVHPGFATDLAEEVIAVARDGLYPFTITADVSEERLRRFFQRTPRLPRPARAARVRALCRPRSAEGCTFSRLDMFTCRNLLIYLSS